MPGTDLRTTAMKVNFEQTFGGGCDSDIQSLEAEAGIRFPPQYKEFLRDVNGGRPGGRDRLVTALDTIVILDVLFGLNVPSDFDIQYWHDFYCDDLPQWLIAVGADPFGNMFLLDLENKGVYYWDQVQLLNGTSSQENAFKVEGDLRDFLYGNFSGNETCFEPAISGPLGPKALESVWNIVSGHTAQEINRKVFIEFSGRDAIAFNRCPQR